MKYPDCPENREDCRFQNLGGSVTCMWSPIEYDREGRPVAGGDNFRNMGVQCNVCGKRWGSVQTELEDAQGKPRVWVAL